MNFEAEISRRRTFGIVSHPDAGKTTLTEKLLLFGGAIQEAGAVKSNKIKKTATSDFMEIERQRGISVATSVLAFHYKNKKINILDTPGHKDFAEDTFRTLTAVDSVIVVIDVAKVLKDLIKVEVEDAFDHKNLNEQVPEFANLNPTAENIAVVMWDKLRPHISADQQLEVTLYETPRNYVHYKG